MSKAIFPVTVHAMSGAIAYVNSATGQGRYRVHLGERTCSCPDYEWNGPKRAALGGDRECKHLHSARREAARRAAEGQDSASLLALLGHPLHADVRAAVEEVLLSRMNEATNPLKIAA